MWDEPAPDTIDYDVDTSTSFDDQEQWPEQGEWECVDILYGVPKWTNAAGSNNYSGDCY
jgi:hypothetical protein